MLYRPDKCMRERTDCNPLANIVSDPEFGEPQTFICCGENSPSCRSVEQDEYTLCIKSNEGVDDRRNLDKRDIIDQISVMAQSLSMIENE